MRIVKPFNCIYIIWIKMSYLELYLFTNGYCYLKPYLSRMLLDRKLKFTHQCHSSGAVEYPDFTSVEG